METVKRYYKDLDFDSLIFTLLSLAAILFGVVSFLGIVPVTGEQLSSILIGSVGILMASVVALTAKRKNEIKEIKEAVGISESKIIYSIREVEEHLASGARQANRFILDTSLNRVLPEPMPVAFFSGIEDGYRRAVYDRTRKGEVSFKRVEIIFHQQGLEWAIFRLLLHEGYDYQIRHYDPPSQPIPMLSFVSFDNATFYMGGFHLKGAPTEESALAIKESNFAKVLSDYWSIFWVNATPLNEGGTINWKELKKIGVRVGIYEEQFEDIVDRLKAEVAKERRKVSK